nr:tetratricopeptide repeat protein [Methylocystis sp. WRRC1]
MAALVGLSGCSKTLNDVTGSIGRSSTPALPKDEGALRQFAEEWGRRYDANPKDKATAMTYARALHALDQNAQAVAVLQGLAIQNPEDMKVLGAYGKALADAGQLKQAADVLQKAHTPERPDWSVLSTQGSIADQLGDHEGARGYYETALKIRPNEPSVLSNLGLSYALARNLPRAEEVLRAAAAQPGADMRVRQNLALVLALQGKFDQAEEWSRRDLSPIDAAQNVASIRQMISQSNTWRDIQTGGQSQRRASARQTEASAAQ